MPAFTKQVARPLHVCRAGLTLVEVVIIAALLALLAALIARPWEVTRGGIRHSCKNQLKQIALALHNYHEDYGCFPPAYVADERGRPMHSWRVLLLPYVDELPLYKQYRFDEPWDGPNNLKVGAQMPRIYLCPDDDRLSFRAATTTYMALTGPGTSFEANRCTGIIDIRDGLETTLLVVESPRSPVPWTKPVDVSPASLYNLLKSTPRTSTPHEEGVNVVWVDGRVTTLPTDVSRATLNAISTVAGGESVDMR
ncbi:MAG: DUF1559 domain-containing protein [Planctomycetes bacterium]|nr:DUF1559 domain-containing protein [Planctomycetota bacterium]